MEYKRLTKLSDLGTLHALDFNGEEQPLCELTSIDMDVLIRRLYELENKIESGELGDVKEVKHRADIFERAFNRMTEFAYDTPAGQEMWKKYCIEQAKKELEEEKDGNVNKR